MNLGEALQRIYEILGDDKANPQEFARADLVTLVNDGVNEFRRRVEDRYGRQDAAVVSGTHTYTQPDQSMRLVRVAYDDRTISPTDVQTLQSIDDKWGIRQVGDPVHWLADAVGHDEYRIWPTPSASTPNQLTFGVDPYNPSWDPENGIITRWNDGTTDDTFVADTTEYPGWSLNDGIMTQRTNTSISAETGETVARTETGADYLTLWYVLRPSDLVNDDDTLPMKRPFDLAPVWWALTIVYEAESDYANPLLAKFYREMFDIEVEKAMELSSKPFAFEVDGAGLNQYNRHELPLGWPGTVDINGTPTRVGWPRDGFWS